MPGIISDTLKTERRQAQAISGESKKKDELWQMPYDNCFFINVENNKKIIRRSYQPSKKGGLYSRSTHCIGMHGVNELVRTDLNNRGTFLFTMMENIRLDDHDRI